MAISLAHAILFSRTSLFLSRNSRSLAFCIPFSTSSSSAAAAPSLPSDKLHRNKWRSPVASVLELGGVKIGREGNLDTQLNFFLLNFIIWVGQPFFFFFFLFSCNTVLNCCVTEIIVAIFAFQQLGWSKNLNLFA